MNIIMRSIIYYTFGLVIALLVFRGESSAQFYQWTSVGSQNQNGVNGTVNAITKLNGNLIYGGSFSAAGTVTVFNVASFNGNSWSILDGGVNDTVFALNVLNGNLYAGGKFSQAGGYPAQSIAKWNGSSWSALNPGLNGRVYAFAVYNGKLVVGGKFTNPYSNIAFWDGSTWTALGSGLNDTVFALAVVGGNLFAGGSFSYSDTTSLNKIGMWNGSTWSRLGSGMNNTVTTITQYNSYIAAGGRFTMAGGSNAQYIAYWNGASWSGLGFTLDNYVTSLVSYNNSLIVGGTFINISFGTGSIYMNHICKWDASGCQRMVTGMSSNIRVLYTSDTSIYAGGDFVTAGGDFANHAAVWSNVPTHTISGIVKYADNNQPVTTGVVKAVRLDYYTREVIVIDSALIQSNGTYMILQGFNDSTDIVAFPNDELADNFVPTYYPSTINWANAIRIYPSSNLNNININVIRAQSGGTSFSNISGHVNLNFVPSFQPGFPYSKDAIVYASQSGIFRKFAVSDSTEKYTLTGLAPGTYDLTVYRLGYRSASRSVTLGTTNVDTIDFYLDTVNVIGIEKISTTVPSAFSLHQNYPNPFNPSTTIEFEVLRNSNVEITVYNVAGQQIIQLLNSIFAPGTYKLTFDASTMPSGIYFYRMISESFVQTRKMVLIK